MRVEFGAQPGPAFLHAGRQSALFGEKCDGLHVHAHVGPLAVAHAFVDDEEEADRRAEELVVVGEPADAAGAVFLRDTDLLVHHFADPFAAFVVDGIDFLEVGIDGAFEFDRGERVLRQHIDGEFDDLVLRRAGDGDCAPWLEIAAGGRALGRFEQLCEFVLRDRVGQEGAGGDALADGLGDVHARVVFLS